MTFFTCFLLAAAISLSGTTVDTNGVRWVDGRRLPIEGRAFENVDAWYDRLPSTVTTNVNAGVRTGKHRTPGMQFRFVTDSKTLRFRWKTIAPWLSTDHMPATGVSGIDVYRLDAATGAWRYVKTGRITDRTKGGFLTCPWTPGTPCLVNLPLYNGLGEFALGLDVQATLETPPPRKSGITKPVVFYGSSITQGGCCSRPGMAFVNIIGRRLDVPVVNLGFSGCGKMEFEMSEHLAAIDASCYVLDSVHNMSLAEAQERYEPFVRNLRAKRPGVPIVMVEQCDLPSIPVHGKDRVVQEVHRKLVAEKWERLVYLPKSELYSDDLEGTVDGVHPNDHGMMELADSYGKAVKKALGL